MSLLTYALATQDDVSDILRSDKWAAGGDEEAEAIIFINAATIEIENICDNIFVQRTISAERHSAGVGPRKGGVKKLRLHRYPIVSVTSIADDDGNTVAATEYRIDYDGLEWTGGGWRAPIGAWKVTYVAGRFADTASVTEDLRVACALLARDRWRSRNPAQASVSTGQRSESYAPRLPVSPEVMALLNPYISREVA